ncbi:MAG: D-alanyl-D-alanine carboxypeptidase family protein [Burkholderiaceae bacterium]
MPWPMSKSRPQAARLHTTHAKTKSKAGVSGVLVRLRRVLLLLAIWPWAFPPVLAQTSLTSAGWPEPPNISARSYALIDLSTGQSLASKDDQKIVPPMGLSGLMTAYVALQAVRDRKIRLNQTIAAPPEAEIPPGPKMFLSPEGAAVNKLLEGLFIIGAHDAALALANAISGSEQAFVATMNATATRIGMTNTQFVSSTGGAELTLELKGTTTARDMALLANQMFFDFPDAFAVSRQRALVFNSISQNNKNRLLWLDRTVDGLYATDFSRVSSSLVTAQRPQPIGPKDQVQRRLLVVLLDVPSPEQRSADALKLLNFGYQKFDLIRLFRQDERPTMLQVFKGIQDQVRVEFRRDVNVAVPRGATQNLRAELSHPRGLLAPILAGQPVGQLRIWLGAIEIHRVDLVAAESVRSAGLLGRAIDSLRLWLTSLTTPSASGPDRAAP